MKEVKRFDGFGIVDEEGCFVRHKEYAALQKQNESNEALLYAMRQDMRESREKMEAMGHECGKMMGLLNDICRYHEECTHDDQMHALIPLEYVSAINTFVGRDVDGENPFASTDAFLNEVRAEGIHFAVNRMLAAWESGFVNDTPEQAFDISGGFLTALEFLPNASPDEFKRDYLDEVRAGIAARLRAGSTEGGV